MNLALPSGAVVCVEEPRLRAVLTSGGSAAALIDAVWVHEMDPERLLPEDRTLLLDWCLENLAQDEEALSFAVVCMRFGTPPSQRLGIADPVLALTCDYFFSQLLDGPGEPTADQEDESEADAIRFTTPEVA